MVGMARRAVPARVVAGGTNIRATQASEGVAPLHAARTSQRDVPTTLSTYFADGVGRDARPTLGFMESLLSFFRMHWDHELRTSETAPPRCCRHLAGSAYLRLLCRQDAGSTLGFMESEAFLVGRGRTRRSWLLLAFVGATLSAGEPESAKTASVGARS